MTRLILAAPLAEEKEGNPDSQEGDARHEAARLIPGGSSRLHGGAARVQQQRNDGLIIGSVVLFGIGAAGLLYAAIAWAIAT
jgi:hypothetical protein